ncbi:hypothetical protein KL86DPRO_20528 [uncultured delta proteobacterium]|uniref:Uncharacterized protein n=1 Tax=uncultured delta proteobacterium TaxID=34034 RepID=A0A212K225_9DELT|nr:hypothetical protein KL86DPRO_20528 [uncultured delta proteobacterium]
MPDKQCGPLFQVGRIVYLANKKTALFRGILYSCRKGGKKLSWRHSRCFRQSERKKNARLALAIFYFLDTADILPCLFSKIPLRKPIFLTGLTQQRAEQILFLIHSGSIAGCCNFLLDAL